MGSRSDYSHIPNNLVYEAFRGYNEAIKKWLTGITTDKVESEGSGIPVVWGTPERFLADVYGKRVEGQIDLPAISFYLSNVTFKRDRRFIPPFTTYTTQTIQVGNKTIYRKSPKALPYDLTYVITAWTKHYAVAGIIDWNILSRFTPLSYIDANGIASPMYVESVTDNSELEPGENKDRVIRHEYSIRVEGWMALEYQEIDSTISGSSIDITDDVDDVVNINGDKITGVEINEKFVEGEGNRYGIGSARGLVTFSPKIKIRENGK